MVDVSGSQPMLPEVKTVPLYLTACENWGRGAGAAVVETVVKGAMLGFGMPINGRSSF